MPQRKSKTLTYSGIKPYGPVSPNITGDLINPQPGSLTRFIQVDPLVSIFFTFAKCHGLTIPTHIPTSEPSRTTAYAERDVLLTSVTYVPDTLA